MSVTPAINSTVAFSIVSVRPVWWNPASVLAASLQIVICLNLINAKEVANARRNLRFFLWMSWEKGMISQILPMVFRCVSDSTTYSRRYTNIV